MSTPAGGSVGVKSVYWTTVRKALRTLGGRELRVTGKHNSLQIKMPTDFLIATGKISLVKGNLAMQLAVTQLLEQVRAARIDPMLFLAVLDNLDGVVWYRKPVQVSQLAKYLRAERPALTNPTQWRAAVTGCTEQLRKSEEERMPEPTEQVEPTTPQERDYRYTIGDALRMTEIKEQLGEDRFKAVQVGISNELRRSQLGVASPLRDRLGEELQVVRRGKSYGYRLSADGAMALALSASAKHLPETQLQVETPAPALEPQEAAQEPSLQVLLSQDGVSPGGRIVAFCLKQGLAVPWRDDNPYEIDRDALVGRLMDLLS